MHFTYTFQTSSFARIFSLLSCFFFLEISCAYYLCDRKTIAIDSKVEKNSVCDVSVRVWMHFNSWANSLKHGNGFTYLYVRCSEWFTFLLLSRFSFSLRFHSLHIIQFTANSRYFCMLLRIFRLVRLFLYFCAW